MTSIKKTAISVKNHVSTHKAAYALGAVALAAIALQQRNLKVTNEFLKEHGLYEEYWTPEDSY